MALLRTASINHWPDSACARAFWGQQDLAPYDELLADTTAWLDPAAGERWLDLGCGCGKLSEALWHKSNGTVAEVVGLDCAAVNAKAFERLRQTVQPTPREDQVRFVQVDFSGGLAGLGMAGQVDGVVSGLAIQYAERYREDLGRWTTEAYDHLLADVYRVLRPGGRFVFSVNVPEPGWGKVALRSLPGLFRTGKVRRRLKNAWRLWRYGRWLSREARVGRFHYLPVENIVARLAAVGFRAIEHRRTYVGQAYLLRCRKPGAL